MATRRGLLAELNHQARLADQRKRSQQAAAHRAEQAAIRSFEQAQRAAQHAQKEAERATLADERAAVRAAKEANEAAIRAAVEVKNAELAVVADDLDNILASSLAVDDWVDLSTLRVTAQHPPFDRTDLEIPLPPPPPPAYPSEPIYLEPAAPHGMSGMFGGKKKHEAAVETSKAQHAENVKSWQIYCAQVNEHHAEQVREHHAAETQRLANLDAARAEYRHACQGREDAAAKQNAQLDRLINDLGFDVESAIQEYVGIVLSNSIYPTHFPISYEHEFSLATRELRLQVHVPEPASVSTIKEYRYIRAKDDITATQLPLKAVKRPLRAGDLAGSRPIPARGVRRGPRRTDPRHLTHRRV